MDKNTVFIIGAGASSEAGLPTGAGLKEIIIPKLDLTNGNHKKITYDLNILKALEKHCKDSGVDINNYGAKAIHISEALPLAISIDNFIDAHKGNPEVELCAKLAIVQSILEAEKSSLLNYNIEIRENDIDYSKLEKTWYLYFFQLLTENSEFDQLEIRFQSITLIIFNYDRCIEHFMIHAIKRYYNVSIEEARDTTNKIKIYHPYGKVGALLNIDSEHYIKFGDTTINSEQLLLLTNKIKTFTESTDKEPEYLEKIHTSMRNAERLIFLGFGYHELNMRLLTLPNINEINNSDFDIFPDCYASAFEIEENGQNIIKDRILSIYDTPGTSEETTAKRKEKIEIKNAKCKDFFAYYLMSLGF